MLRLRHLFLVCLLIVSIALSGCNPAAFRTEAAQIPRLVVSGLSDPKTFNPVTSNEVSDVFGLIYDGLLSSNGETGELEPGLAEAWDVSPDQLRIVFTLRENLKWSDGEPFTVDDVVFSFNNIYFNPKIPSSAADVLRIGEKGQFPQVRKLDNRRFEVITPEPFAPIVRFVGGIEILPQHIVEPLITQTDAQGAPRFVSALGTDTPPSQIVGSGPYRMLEYTSSERIVLERNPFYWRKDAEGNQQPYIDRYVVQITESVDASLVQFRSGGLDLIGVSANYFALMKREEERGGFRIYEGGPSLSSNFVMFNLNQGRRNGVPVVDPIRSRWFNTLEFRQAIAYAIDRPRMINNTFQGLGASQTSPIPVQSPYYLSPEEGLPFYEFNLEKAKELLQKAGFKYNAQGQLLDAESNRVSFSLTTNAENNLRVAMGAQIKQDLSKIGIDVNFTPIAFNTLVDKMDNTFDWNMILLGFSGAGIEPDGGRNIWSVNGRLHAFNQKPGEGQEPLEGREVADWEAEIDRLYVQGSQQLDENKRKAVYAEAQKLILTQVPFIYLVNPIAMSAVRDRVENVRYTALGGSLWNIYELRVQQN